MKFNLQIHRRISQGFSLVEMSVVLVIVALIGAVIWRLMPLFMAIAMPNTPQQDLQAADQSLRGFILANNRLPCPDTDDDGEEDCAASNMAGTLPYDTLGIHISNPMRYGVYRVSNATDTSKDADLAVVKGRFTPVLPYGTGEQATQQAVINGLDFCQGLKQGQVSPSLGSVQAGGIAVAYALAVPGKEDRDNNGSLFDGINSGNTFTASRTPISNSYDDLTLAKGFGELSGDLGCVASFARVNGAARSAYMASDVAKFADQYSLFRDFAYKVAETDLDMAEWGVAMAATDLALGVMDAAIAVADIAVAVGEGNGVDIAVATAGGVAAGAAVVLAGINVGMAKDDLDAAKEGLATAQKQKEEAAKYKTAMATQAATAYTRAKAMDQKGLQQ